jgi:DNA-binding IclR family transcriptional regulator
MTKSSREGSDNAVKSVHRAMDVLEFLREHGDATVTEIANGIDISVSTAYNHLTTLSDREYVEREGDEYRIGVRFLAFGGAARRTDPLFRNGSRTLDELAARTDETARLVVDRAGYGITLCQSTGDRVRSPRTYTGIEETLHSTAAGKAILAHYDEETVEEVLETHGLPDRTERTITDRDELLADLERIRDRGVAFDIREHFEDVICVAGPIIQEGTVVGAVSLSAPTDRRDEAWLRSEAAAEIRNATGVIKVNSTYSSWVEAVDDDTDRT